MNITKEMIEKLYPNNELATYDSRYAYINILTTHVTIKRTLLSLEGYSEYEIDEAVKPIIMLIEALREKTEKL